jgi:hypothetical protein
MLYDRWKLVRLLLVTKVAMVLVMASSTMKLVMEPLRRRLWGMRCEMMLETTVIPRCESEECI